MDVELHLPACMIREPRIIEPVSLLVRSSDFTNKECGMLFDALQTMHRDGRPVDDPAILAASIPHILNSGILSRDALRDAVLESDVANYQHYCALIRDNAQRVSLARALSDVQARLQRGDEIAKVIDYAGVQVEECRNKLLSVTDEHIATALNEQAQWLIDEDDESSGDLVSIGLSVLDRYGAGLAKPGLNIIGGATSAGKSALVIQWCEMLARQGYAIYAFSLEMERRKVAQRIHSQNGIAMNVWQSRFGTPLAMRQQMADVARKTALRMEGYRYKVNERVFDFDTLVRRAKAEAATCGLDFLIVDHAGLVEFRDARTHKARHEVLYGLTRDLKVLAGTLNCGIILVSQFSKAGIANHDLTSEVWDGCKTLTQNADAAFLLHYLNDKDKDKRLFWVQKMRNGEKEFGVHLEFDGVHQLFTECSDVVCE